MPFQLGYRPKNICKKQKAPTFVGASENESELGNLVNNQTNSEGRARLTRRLIMDLVFIVIFEVEYNTPSFLILRPKAFTAVNPGAGSKSPEGPDTISAGPTG